MAAVLAAGDGAALGNEAAAWHWNIWRRKPSQIDVITPGQRRPRATGSTGAEPSTREM